MMGSTWEASLPQSETQIARLHAIEKILQEDAPPAYPMQVSACGKMKGLG